jgi:hypothetical protein
MSDDTVSQWAIVELMGHKVVAGLVTKSEQLGKPMLRVDVPETSAHPSFTQFYGETSIYCITFVSEEVARLTAERCQVNPVSVYVPDLITREQHDEAINQMRQRLIDDIDRASRGLPAGSQPDEVDDEENDDADFDG